MGVTSLIAGARREKRVESRVLRSGVNLTSVRMNRKGAGERFPTDELGISAGSLERYAR